MCMLWHSQTTYSAWQLVLLTLHVCSSAGKHNCLLEEGQGVGYLPKNQAGFSEKQGITGGEKCDSCLCRSTGGVYVLVGLLSAL